MDNNKILLPKVPQERLENAAQTLFHLKTSGAERNVASLRRTVSHLQKIGAEGK